MTKKELINQLQNQFLHPQQSERWVMYRIINPIIDYSTDLLPYYEYPQAKDTPASQKIDIALFENNNPIFFIEAKKIRKGVEPDLILKYIKEYIVGMASNGCNWVIVIKEKNGFIYSYITIFDEDKQKIDEAELDILISILKCKSVNEISKLKIKWSTDKKEIFNRCKTFIPPYTKAQKIYHDASDFSAPNDVINYINQLKNLSEVIKTFCNSMLTTAKTKPKIYYRARKSRLSWFHHESKRLGRIEFHGNIANILVKTEIVDKNPILEQIVKSDVHSKHRGMRWFKIYDKNTAKIFGEELGRIITNLN